MLKTEASTAACQSSRESEVPQAGMGGARDYRQRNTVEAETKTPEKNQG